MNEAETRAELIDPKLKACGWGIVEGSKVLREYHLTEGKIQPGGGRSKKIIADYILVYKGIKLAVIEAKSDDLGVGEGVAQAKQYAEKLKLETTYSSNGKEIYSICMRTGAEGLVDNYLTPDELWEKTFPTSTTSVATKNSANKWRLKFSEIPFEDKSGTWQLRYYQEIAVRNTLEAVANSKERILLTLATGTGKTAIAFQIAWKLFQTKWNLKRDGNRSPRILFLADRNILADQAYNSFSSFPEDALVRIKPKEIRKKGNVPTNGSIFFTIFQTFMSGNDKEGKPAPYFGAYPPDYFDFIIIDECHRGGANDESNWRAIMEYFSPAVQLGLTATPKRKDNVDTYKYFGEPVYVYSLKEGINDGFLTPFKVKRIKTTLDDYIYTSDDKIIEGEIEEGRLYTEPDFNRIIEIKAREAKRVQIYMYEANQKEKAIIFCATQDHAAAIRDLVNQYKKSSDPNYCVRVTANDGEEGERFLREFQDNEKTIPTILTSSQKLSTGVDARNIRNIVLMRPVNSMIEFKQIVGRGTRLFDGKEFFTIYDYVDAFHHFADPEWDGEPLDPEPVMVKEQGEQYKYKEREVQTGEQSDGKEKRKRIKIKLRDGKEREIQSMIATSFWSAEGKPISAEEFLNNLFGELPNLFKSEEELRIIWSNPITRKALLDKLEEAGFPKSDLIIVQQLVNMEKSDLFDVLEYVFNGNYTALTREQRVAASQATILALLNEKQKEFIEFVLAKYIEAGVEELDQEKLPNLLENKYQSLEDAKSILGKVGDIRTLFIEFQKHLYEQRVA
ncbi:MAG TPA: DEAD/DEAH box helicase family protein [Bacteroidia bacterium]|jgi:type I restriction enzyme R subunit|nr:DEAD/DEAH box helicase family protein [Bacteroidia bacterium]